jgi:CRISPR system Cascade subunit CasA
MPLNLLAEPWLPLKRRSGVTEWVSPAHLTDRLGDDPFVAPNWGRADFDAATVEFLIGLLATALCPATDEDWRDCWSRPPSREALAAAFAPLAPAFNLDGDGPRFMQEWGGIGGEASPVAGLFIEAPGANTEKNNADLFQKRGRFTALGLPAAAIALFTLQTYAPSGGAGHRTSMRGGGPLTTLVLPKAIDALWARIWLNVPLVDQPLPLIDGGATVFPWLAPTRTSEKGTLPIDLETLHPLVAFWWMPRRIRLDVEASEPDAECGLTGERTGQHVSHYRTTPWGMNGASAAHPLSPVYRNKANEVEWLFVHPQPGGLSYHHWVDLVFASKTAEATRRPAAIVTHILSRRRSAAGQPARLWAAGYDMDNMKARGFVEAMFPVFLMEGEHSQAALAEAARALVAAAQQTASATRGAVRGALNIEKADASLLQALNHSFYDATQSAFFACVEEFAALFAEDDQSTDSRRIKQRFLDEALRPTALRLFDQAAPLTALGVRHSEIEKHIAARRSLALTLKGYGKAGGALFDALVVEKPVSKTPKARSKKQVAA